MNNNTRVSPRTLLGIYADIQELADVGISFYESDRGTEMLPEAEEDACRRATKIIQCISDEPDPEPPKQPINWLHFQKEEEYIPKEIGWALTFYKKRTNLKAHWSRICARMGGKS